MLLTLAAARAVAQGTPKRTEGYSALVASAVAAFEAGRYLEARGLMLRAHQLKPNARTLRGMGLAAFEAELYAQAVVDFEGALHDPRQPMNDTQRAEVERLQAEAIAKSARYRLTGQRPGAVLLLDGAAPLWDAGGLMLVDAGAHVLTLRPAGDEERTLALDAKGGAWFDLDLATLKLTEHPGPVAPESNPWNTSEAAALTAAASAPPEAAAEPLPARLPAEALPAQQLAAPKLEPERTVFGPMDPPEGEPEESSDLTTALVATGFGGAAIAAGVAIWQWRVRESEVTQWNSSRCLAGGRMRRDNCGSHERAYQDAERWSLVAAGATLALSAGAVTLLLLDDDDAGADEGSQEGRVRCIPGAFALSCRVSF